MQTPKPPQPLSRAALREVDRRATEELGIPGIVLMENAARGAVAHALDMPWSRPDPVWILCGPGNNGGDGYAIARWLAIHGSDVHLVSFGALEDAKGDARTMREICARMDIPEHVVRERGDLDRFARRLAEASLLVDALLGTGFHGEVRSPLDRAIELMNVARQPDGPRILAIDVPSGFDADAGTVGNAAVRADRTATFVAPKLGFDARDAVVWTGEVGVESIGVPPALVERVRAEGL